MFERKYNFRTVSHFDLGLTCLLALNYMTKLDCLFHINFSTWA